MSLVKEPECTSVPNSFIGDITGKTLRTVICTKGLLSGGKGKQRLIAWILCGILWHIFSLACLQSWTTVHPIWYFSGSILIFSQKGRPTAGKWKMSKIFPSSSAMNTEWPPTHFLFRNPGDKFAWHCKNARWENKQSTNCEKQGPQQKGRINLNILVSFVLILCASLGRSTHYFISSSDLVSVLFLWLYLFPLLSAEDMGKKGPPPLGVECITLCPNEDAVRWCAPSSMSSVFRPALLMIICTSLWDSNEFPTQLSPFVTIESFMKNHSWLTLFDSSPFGFLKDVRVDILLQCHTGGQIHPQDFYLL